MHILYIHTYIQIYTLKRRPMGKCQLLHHCSSSFCNLLTLDWQQCYQGTAIPTKTDPIPKPVSQSFPHSMPVTRIAYRADCPMVSQKKNKIKRSSTEQNAIKPKKNRIKKRTCFTHQLSIGMGGMRSTTWWSGGYSIAVESGRLDAGAVRLMSNQHLSFFSRKKNI